MKVEVIDHYIHLELHVRGTNSVEEAEKEIEMYTDAGWIIGEKGWKLNTNLERTRVYFKLYKVPEHPYI